MDLALQQQDVELAATLDALLSKESSSSRIRAAETLGFDAELWRTLTDLGVPGLAVGEDAATPQQLVIIAEQAGRHLASAPVVESLVTARLLDRCGTTDLLEQVESGTIATLALTPQTGGTAPLVPAGAVAGIVVAYDGQSLFAVQADAPMTATPNLGSQPLADRDLSAGERTELATGERAAALFDSAVLQWQLLTAAQLVGIAARAHEIAVDYVRERVIFDKPVGAFQTVNHRLADHAANIDGARLLMQEAAWASEVGDVSSARAASLTKMAYIFAAEQAYAATNDSLHYHGGYGFTREYDIQLYFRRAKALPLALGSLRRENAALADRLYGPVFTGSATGEAGSTEGGAA